MRLKEMGVKFKIILIKENPDINKIKKSLEKSITSQSQANNYGAKLIKRNHSWFLFIFFFQKI